MMAKTPEGMTYRAFLVTLPLHRPIPVGGVSWTERPVVLIRAEDSEGRTAWGEAAPLDGYGSDTLADVLDALSQPEWTRTNELPSLVCALETAHMGLAACRGKGVFGLPQDEPALTNLTPAALGADGSLEGATHVKIKVGRGGSQVDTDIERIRILSARYPDLQIRLDGNGLLTRDDALRLIEGLEGLYNRIDFFEEPWRGGFDQDIRGVLPVPVAIDESLAEDNWQCADVCILKPSLMGSPAATMALARRVQAAGRRVTVSSAFESQVGMIMVTRLAALIGDTAPGLGTYAYMADDWGRRAPWWDETSVSIERLPAIPRSAVVPGPSPMARRRFESGLKVEEVSR